MPPSLASLNQSRPGAESDPFTPERYRQVGACLPISCATILDVGCCTGRGGQVLRQLRPDATIIGLEIVGERLESIPKGIYNQKLVGAMHSMDLPDSSVDAVIAAEVIEHIPPALVDASLCEAFRVLKLKGQLILTTRIRRACGSGGKVGASCLKRATSHSTFPGVCVRDWQ